MEIYDETAELQFENFASKLDTKPIVVIQPVENSSYLNFTLYISDEGFQYMIQPKYEEYLAYLDVFIKKNIGTPDGRKYLESTLRRLSSKYSNIHQRFVDSAERQEWKNQSKNFIIPNPHNDFNIEKQQKYTRQAYKFFWKISGVQLYFIDGIKQYIDQQLQPFVNSELKTDSRNIINSANVEIFESNIYHFSIRPEANKDSHNVLQHIWKKLKDNEFISCTLPQFKQVFTSKTPTPIVWHKDYIQLSYLIKNMSPKFLLKSKAPSNYLIATKLFYNKTEGVLFNPSKIRHDKNPNPTDKFIIDQAIVHSIDYFILN